MKNGSHKIKLDPSTRLLGNAVLVHILADECYGRMKLIRYHEDVKPLIIPQYEAMYECAICKRQILSKTSKRE